ncbi:hypothetical protein D3C85_1437900 [compost metagenome]
MCSAVYASLRGTQERVAWRTWGRPGASARGSTGVVPRPEPAGACCLSAESGDHPCIMQLPVSRPRCCLPPSACRPWPSTIRSGCTCSVMSVSRVSTKTSTRLRWTTTIPPTSLAWACSSTATLPSRALGLIWASSPPAIPLAGQVSARMWRSAALAAIWSAACRSTTA